MIKILVAMTNATMAFFIGFYALANKMIGIHEGFNLILVAWCIFLGFFFIIYGMGALKDGYKRDYKNIRRVN